MILHPRFQTLARYAEGQGAPRLHEHLRTCFRCRAIVTDLRDVTRAARESGVPPLPDTAWAAILERRRLGDRVILPAEAVTREPGRLSYWIAAAVVALLIPVAVMVFPVKEAGAERRELILSSSLVRAGSVVEVHYRPSAIFAGATKLVLRARLRTANGQWENWRALHAPLATLVREGAFFRGSVRLPDSVLYAVLSVEDTSGSRIDANGEQWEILRAGSDGRPSLAALEQKFMDLDRRDARRSYATLETITRLYPTSVYGWLYRYYADRAANNTRPDVYRNELHRLEASYSARQTDAATLSQLADFADALGDSVLVLKWRTELQRAFPGSDAAVAQLQDNVIDAAGKDPAKLLAAYDKLWLEVDTTHEHRQLTVSALRMADAVKDAPAIERWGERIVRFDPAARRTIANYFLRYAVAYEPLRARALALADETVAMFMSAPERERPLDVARADNRIRYRGYAGFMIALRSAVLLAQGDTSAALADVARASGLRWNAEVFRRGGDLELLAGDTASALTYYSKVAADPLTTSTIRDSLQQLASTSMSATDWNDAVANARAEMRRYFLSTADVLPLRGRVDALGDLSKPTVMVLWSKNCPRAVSELGRLQAIASHIVAAGGEVVLITPDEQTPQLDEFFLSRKFTIPVRYDSKHQTHTALPEWGFPHYLVLDAHRRIRFRDYTVEDELVRQVASLAGQTVAVN